MIKWMAKMEWIIGIVALIVGAGSGTGITYSLMKNKKPQIQIVETNKVIEKMVEVDRSLTDQDLLKVPCSKEYMEKNGDILCREMFCRMNTRSGNSSNSASSKECETIGNILNKRSIYKLCEEAAKVSDTTDTEFDTKKKQCIEFFDRRI